MSGPRTLRRIAATTDVHSSFDDALPMLAHLHAIRPETLIVDCGDFFEGSGYYRLGHGRIETAILLGLYDVIAPENHGWIHHFESPVRNITVCANAVDAATGQTLFRRLHTTRIGEQRVGITAVIGSQAFHSIPKDQRAGHRVTEPAQALREVMLAHHHEVDAWVVLSHSGFDEDLELAAACPFLNVVFAGHCHSDQHGPTRVGETLVLKGRELGVGYALAEPTPTRWTAHNARFPGTSTAALPAISPPSMTGSKTSEIAWPCRSAPSPSRTEATSSTAGCSSATSPPVSARLSAPKPSSSTRPPCAPPSSMTSSPSATSSPSSPSTTSSSTPASLRRCATALTRCWPTSPRAPAPWSLNRSRCRRRYRQC